MLHASGGAAVRRAEVLASVAVRASSARIAGMPLEGVQNLMQHIGFDEQDAANLRVLAAHEDELVGPALDRFYEVVLRRRGTRSVLPDRPEQMAVVRTAIEKWLRGLFGGVYDTEYWELRRQIGRTHVRIGLPQDYVFAGIEVIWEQLEAGIRRLTPTDASAKLVSLHKLLMLELAVILSSYKESYSEEIRQFERDAVLERLIEAEHLAQIGQLAASLAHEIKNPLAGISGAIQIIRDSASLEAAHRPVLDEVLRQVHRLDQTVKDLLVYARPKPPKFRKVNLEQLLARALPVLREQPEMHRIRFEYVNHQPLPMLMVDENQLEQVLTNLLLNAAQASADHGLVRLTTMVRPEGVRLIVEDHGHGMDEEVRRRATEPFFTTKAKGTGLGLPICRKIVETHGGTLTISSSVGEGTEVMVDLPRQPPASGGTADDDSRAAG